MKKFLKILATLLISIIVLVVAIGFATNLFPLTSAKLLSYFVSPYNCDLFDTSPQKIADLQKKAEQKNRESQIVLALYYGGGCGIPKDMNRSFALVKDAADAGYAPAYYLIAPYYMLGNGVKQDETKAFEWFLKSAQNGHGANQVALFYEKGMGTPVNYYESYIWYIIDLSTFESFIPDMEKYLESNGKSYDSQKANNFITTRLKHIEEVKSKLTQTEIKSALIEVKKRQAIIKANMAKAAKK